MFSQNRYYFSIALSKEQLLEIYRGSVQRVRVRTTEGLILDLDANNLKEFTTKDGIYGNFVLITTKENKFVRLEQLD